MKADQFIKEISKALGIPVQKSGSADPIYFIHENGLSVFDAGHKVSICYQPNTEDQATTNTLFPNQDLKMAVIDAYKNARIEIANRKSDDTEAFDDC
ncbi:hypothetical protein ACKC5Q_05110 [Aeromonas dhakensis]|uniref:hypothetical protein n=1 Tax=Aeromonas dhakensis TaxID=196024 RepID=UPI0038B42333